MPVIHECIETMPFIPVTDPLAERTNPCIDKYIFLADQTLKIISVFDDLRYDRADADILSVGMRKHAITRLGKLGFRQQSGTVITHSGSGINCIIPKFHALGASPFDSVRYTKKAAKDYYLLTPTQTACRLVDNLSNEELVAKLENLIKKHPINLYRIMDFLQKDDPRHGHFLEAMGYLLHFQRRAVEREPLKSMRALQ